MSTKSKKDLRDEKTKDEQTSDDFVFNDEDEDVKKDKKVSSITKAKKDSLKDESKVDEKKAPTRKDSNEFVFDDENEDEGQKIPTTKPKKDKVDGKKDLPKKGAPKEEPIVGQKEKTNEFEFSNGDDDVKSVDKKASTPTRAKKDSPKEDTKVDQESLLIQQDDDVDKTSERKKSISKTKKDSDKLPTDKQDKPEEKIPKDSKVHSIYIYTIHNTFLHALRLYIAIQ